MGIDYTAELIIGVSIDSSLIPQLCEKISKQTGSDVDLLEGDEMPQLDEFPHITITYAYPYYSCDQDDAEWYITIVAESPLTVAEMKDALSHEDEVRRFCDWAEVPFTGVIVASVPHIY